MTKRAAEETVPSLESSRIAPDAFGYYVAQVEELLSQEENASQQKCEVTNKASTEIIGAEFSDLKTENLNALLRQYVWNSIPEIDEIQSRVDSLLLMSQLNNKKPCVNPEDPKFEEVEDEIKLLMNSDPNLVKEIVSKHSSDLIARMSDMQQQVEKMLDNVVTTCRPMTRGEKRDLKKSIKELPRKNLERVAIIIKNHYAALGKELTDENVILVNLEEEDNVLLWRLYYSVAAVKRARELGS